MDIHGFIKENRLGTGIAGALLLGAGIAAGGWAVIPATLIGSAMMIGSAAIDSIPPSSLDFLSSTAPEKSHTQLAQAPAEEKSPERVAQAQPEIVAPSVPHKVADTSKDTPVRG